MIRKTLPKFKSEKEEAQWWYEPRDETAQWTEEAVARGETTTLSEVLERRRQRDGSTATVSIRIDPEDIERARLLAPRKACVIKRI
jgi:hypothetical protein